jgi:sulfite exporter TauE/SafE
MDGFSLSLILSAAAIGITHTMLGVDHYLPFVMLARSGSWSRRRLVVVTAVCGLGHVLSSLLLGGIGIALGITVGRLERLEAGRGATAAWLLLAFGLAYGVWGARRALRRSGGIEPHAHTGGMHVHLYGDRPHEHEPRAWAGPFWTLFAIFVLGPCEPLIPLFVLPASRGRFGLAAVTAVVFGVATLATMIGLTLLASAGLTRLRARPLERWRHALAGALIAVSGLSILCLGL